MSLADDLRTEVKKIFRETWEVRDGVVVPEPADLKLSNDAVHFDRATILYADLSGSTSMVDTKTWGFAAEIYKTYLFCAAKAIRACGGIITSYDGDRVMGVFIGSHQSTNATKCGLQINYIVQEIINPALAAQYPTASFKVEQVVGIDTSEVRAARTGVRGGNDIVWVGRAANYAAKLTAINTDQRTWITSDVFKKITDEAKYGGPDKTLMWKSYNWTANNNIPIYGSTWRWNL
jgi:class 3 adenylate cyclase